VLVAALPAAEPAKQPRQRMLQGDDARKAEEREKKLAQLQEAGKFEEALKAAEALAELRVKVQGVDHWETVKARWQVRAIGRVLRQGEVVRRDYAGSFALLRQAESLHQKGHYKETQPLLVKILAIKLKALGEEHPDTATSYCNLASNLNAQGKYREAEEGARKALAIHRKILGEEHPDTAESYSALAGSLSAEGKHTEAEEGYRKALTIRRKVLGEVQPLTALSYNNLALNLNAQGKYKEAEEGFRKALTICRKVLGEEHPQTALSYNNLALNLHAQGKYKEAEEGYGKALTIRRKVLGENHPNTAISYDNLATILNAQGKHQEAEEYCRKGLAIFREVLGENHPETGSSYLSLATILNAQGKFQETEEYCRKALDVFRKVLGEEHPHTASSYDNLATNLNAQGKQQETEKAARRALAIRRKVLGEEHPDTATSYNNLADNLYAQGRYQEAEKEARKALAIRRKVLGEEHSHTATSYNNVALNLNAQGKYQEAEKSFRKALTICRKVLGEEHPQTALSYNNLASNLIDQGKYQEAEEGLRKSLAIFRKVLGEEHPHTATGYSNVAFNLNNLGKYQEAEEGFRKALAICRKVLGEEHPDTVASYNNLAANLHAQGRYPEAEEGYSKALAILRKVLGEEHPHTARSYDNLATSFNAQGKYPQAEKAARKALAIRRKVLGEEHPDTGRSYHNLAFNLSAQSKYGEAEDDLRKALAIRRKVLGEEHPDTANSYHNLAFNLNAQGRYQEAEEGYSKALAILRKVLGEEHPHTATGYSNVAGNLNDQGKYQEAEKYWLRAAEAFAKGRLYVAATGLERATITSEHSPLPALAAVLARNGKPAAAWQRFEESLARGTWDDLTARLRRPADEQAKQTQLNARLDRLDKLIQNTFSVKEPTPEQIKQREELLTQQRQTLDELADFARYLEDAYGAAAAKVFPRDKIQAALPPDVALVGWLDLPAQHKAADPDGEHWAVLLRSAGPPVWVRLRGSGERDAWTDADTRLPARLRAALQSPSRPWQPLADKLRQQRLKPLAKHLKAGNGLPAVRRLIVLPSTAFAGLPVEVIAGSQYVVSYAHSGTMHAHLRQQPKPSGKGLFALADPIFEKPTVKDTPEPLPPGGVLLTMVLPRSNAHEAGLKPNDVLLHYGDQELAGPQDFKPLPESSDPKKRVPVVVWREGKKLPRPLEVRPGKLGVAIAAEPAPKALAEQRRWDRRLASRSGDGDQWDRLPGSRYEVASLRRLFTEDEAELLLDSEASEQQLSERAKSGALGKYRYVHLATHGRVDNVFPLHSAVILSRDNLPDAKKREQLLLDGQPIPDGRLTAAEVLQQWHLHCDLVTLSACSTALGKYERGEGFVGFAQALVLSGSRAVCLSLWEVPDAATALLMERFYQNLLGKREGLKAPLPKAAALVEAKEWLRTLPRAEALKRAASLSEGVARGKRPKLPPLEVPPVGKVKDPPKVKEDYPYAHPYYWAAFVLIGDPQ
jgi:tetratricopeptide (TPR) repeat protein